LQVIALAQAKRDLERTKILSPVDAVVVSDDSEEGSYVQAGKVVAILNDINRAEVGCQLELDDLYWIWKSGQPTSGSSLFNDSPGQIFDIQPIPATVEFKFADRVCSWAGMLTRFGGTGIDLTTRTIPCKVVVDKPLAGEVRMADGEPSSDITPPPLSTGMFVRVGIKVQPNADLISLPTNSVRSGEVVWIVRNGKLKIQPVKIARRMPDQVLVYASPGEIQEGDRVIVSPLAVAQDGMSVTASSVERTQPEQRP
jgi:multidrug efflux pump subunit AcrA (membrane-fusion protein)